MHAFSQAALKLARIDLWGRSEPGNTHLILIERELRAGILTPPGGVILRQCSSRRGKHSMWGLVQLSCPRCQAVALRSFYDLGLDLQLTSRRALRASRRPGLKALEVSVRSADNMPECHPTFTESSGKRAFRKCQTDTPLARA